jgi:lipopolysaccharide/colanic/teichoic acid biosynthesis glycosyltransferase
MNHSFNIFVAIFMKRIDRPRIIKKNENKKDPGLDKGNSIIKPLRVLYAIIKIAADYILSFLILMLLSPVLLLLSVIIRVSGKGPVIYSQDRIGKDGVPFSIYKFRSMVYDAEKGEPFLSGTGDERVTRIGRFLRKYRLDEIPNFINVLKGELSIVGPRPERLFYINQIIKTAPQYLELQKIKPGITSWGQIEYGYASSVDEMIERLDYDLIYLKNRSFWFDLKIIILTVGTILKGRGV